MSQPKAIKPQPGPQTDFLASNADICIYGGAAGGGKSWALLMEPLRHINNPAFTCAVFRRTTPEIRNPGGLWQASHNLYSLPGINGQPKETTLEWKFPSGAIIKFAGMEHEQDKANWLGSELTLIAIDEANTFSADMFFFLLSRNRSTSGIRPYVRLTTNPDADSWLADFLSWWIDPVTGYPIQERSGKIRWFARVGDVLIWSDSRKELKARYPDIEPKSVTFIPASVHDNKILLKNDPGYISNLHSMGLVERERFLNGNWKIRPEAGKVFNRSWFSIVNAAPIETGQKIRYWDKASIAKGGDYTVGVLMSRGKDGLYYVEDVVRGQWSVSERNIIMRNTAERDGVKTKIWIEQEPGSGGKESADASIRLLSGFVVHAEVQTGSKEQRAEPFAAQVEAGNVRLVRGDWNSAFIEELHGFPQGKHDDQVDGASGAFNKLAKAFNLLVI